MKFIIFLFILLIAGTFVIPLNNNYSFGDSVLLYTVHQIAGSDAINTDTVILITIIVPNVLGVSVNYFCIAPDSVLNGMTTNYCAVDGAGVVNGPAAGNVFLPDAVRTTAGDLVSTTFIAVSIGMILIGAVKILQYRIVASPKEIAVA